MFRYFFSYDKDLPNGTGIPNFSTTHFTWLAVTAAALLLLVLLYRRMKPGSRRRFMRGLAVAIIALEIVREGWLLAIGRYEIWRHMPLHLCGVMIFIEAAAVFTEKRFFKEFAYACGLPGAAAALLTPEPSNYPLMSLQYLQSIVIHALIILVPLLWVTGDGFRPAMRALPKNFALLAGLTAACFGINLLIGGQANYMFVRFAPADTPIALFDKWVGWPWYIGLLLALVFVIWLLMYLPWGIGDYLRRKLKKDSAAV
jgi:hypothetical integral membrane protein (TIGR02206 family)